MRKALKDSPTKNRLLEKAREIVMSKGYEAASIDEICAETKIAKGSFFHYFKNKSELGKELIQDFSQSMSKAMDGCCTPSDDPLERLYSYIDFSAKMAQDPKAKGCLVGTMAQEIYKTHPELQECCGMSFKKAQKRFAEDLKLAKEKYAPDSSVDPETLADFFISVFQGAFVVMKAKKDRSVIAGNAKHLRAYLKSVFGR